MIITPIFFPVNRFLRDLVAKTAGGLSAPESVEGKKYPLLRVFSKRAILS
jgi:hypothetical protein